MQKRIPDLLPKWDLGIPVGCGMECRKINDLEMAPKIEAGWRLYPNFDPCADAKFGAITLVMKPTPTFDPTSNQPPKNPAVRRVWILGVLRLRNTSLRKLAKAEGVTQQAMSYALVGPSARLQAVVAEACGVPVEVLFSEWFDENGNRLGWTRETQRTTAPKQRNVEEEAAA